MKKCYHQKKTDTQKVSTFVFFACHGGPRSAPPDGPRPMWRSWGCDLDYSPHASLPYSVPRSLPPPTSPLHSPASISPSRPAVLPCVILAEQPASCWGVGGFV